jgi:hypothetical protein
MRIDTVSTHRINDVSTQNWKRPVSVSRGENLVLLTVAEARKMAEV